MLCKLSQIAWIVQISLHLAAAVAVQKYCCVLLHVYKVLMSTRP
jgi:hypothetical protein